MSPDEARRSIEAVWRVESTRLIGGLLRFVRDLDRAEDLAHEALLAALERWPASGIPESPGAWLMTAAKNRGVDEARRRRMEERKETDLRFAAEERSADDPSSSLDDDVGDDALRLILVSCHPILSVEARVALTLRLVAGLSTDEIARAFLTHEPTIAQRIVRAKRTIAEARVPFEVPKGPALTERLPSVLEVIYLIFNEGYTATKGDSWTRQELTEDALRLGRMLAALAPDDAEAHGLIALMEIQASRAKARVDASGAPILLADQDRSRWDRGAIQRGLAALQRAEARAAPLGFYAIQAAIAACHARAKTFEETAWARIVALYDALFAVSPSPVVALNRAVAVGMAFGPEEGLRIVEDLAKEPALRSYPWLHSALGDLLSKVGRSSEARAAFERAAFLSKNTRERELLLARAKKLG